MLFNSLGYLAFFSGVVFLYFLLPKKLKSPFLLIASYFFYSCWNVKYSLLMALSTGVTFLTGLGLEKSSSKSKKLWVFFCFTINLGILFIFKYLNFTIDVINIMANRWNFTPIDASFHFLLPVGISFYTFQALGYTIDVYRQDIPAEKNFWKYALFVSFFPQLVAGPIERSNHLLPQIKRGSRFSFENLRLGLIFMGYGYCLKLIIADRAALLVNEAFQQYKILSTPLLLFAAFCFTLQIYCDFYSYSIIAKGSARVLGYDLMDNFREPLFAKSITEFWRRWHISLSTWFKDYLYIPLGGNRKGLGRKSFNLLLVFLVSGLWHGANLTFLLWGLIHGICNIVESAIHSIGFRFKDHFLINGIRRLFTLTIVVLAFIFFRGETITQALAYLQTLFTAGKGDFFKELELVHFGRSNFYVLLIALGILSFVDLLKCKGYAPAALLKDQTPLIVRWIIYLIAIFAILIFGIYGPGYSESQFIYFQF